MGLKISCVTSGFVIAVLSYERSGVFASHLRSDTTTGHVTNAMDRLERNFAGILSCRRSCDSRCHLHEE